MGTLLIDKLLQTVCSQKASDLHLTVGSQPDRFHQPGEVSQYETYEVTEWTDTAPN